MHEHDRELRALRQRIDVVRARVERLEASTGAGLLEHYQAGKLKSDGSFPTTAGKFFAVTRHTVTGPELEGGTPVLTAAADTFYPLVLGSAATAVGNPVLASSIPYRWASPFGAAAVAPNTTVTGTLKGCGGVGLLAGQTVTITAHTGGAVLGTAITNASGVYSISYAMVGTSQSIDLATSGIPRFADGFLTYVGGTATMTNITVFRGTNTMSDGRPSAASGFTCWLLSYPLKNTLNAYDALYSLNSPMTNPGGGAVWTNPNTYPNLSASDGKLHMDFTLAVNSTSATGYPSSVFLRFNVGGTPNHPANPSYIDVTEI